MDNLREEQVIIIALPNYKAGFSKATLVLHRTRRSARQGKLTTLIGSAPRGYALVRSGQRACHRFGHLFGAAKLVRDTLHREPPELARDSGRTFIDGPPRAGESWIMGSEPSSPAGVTAALCSAQLTVDIAPALRGRITITAFRHDISVADMLRDVPVREFPDTDGGQS